MFIFCIVLFIYLHVQFQLRTSEDLEVYELDSVSKDKLEEICDLRQPVLFDFENEEIRKSVNKGSIITNYHAFEVKVRNILEPECSYLPLPLNAAVKLFNEDLKGVYVSENNSDFLQETGVVKSLQYNDEYIRPYMVCNCNYDIMLGSENVITPLRYEINYRNYFYITQGSVKIKMIPPKSSKYLSPYNDYENFEFRSPVNPWNTQPEYKSDFDKVKCLEVNMQTGKIIYIPAYWWYSIKFDKNASISCFRYRTYMNNMAIMPRIFMYTLQNQNVKREIVKKMENTEINEKIGGELINGGRRMESGGDTPDDTEIDKETENTTSIDGLPTEQKI